MMPDHHKIHPLEHKLCICWGFSHLTFCSPFEKWNSARKPVDTLLGKEFPKVIILCLVSSQTSTDVCQHLRQCFGDHPAAVLGDGPLPHPDAESPRVYPLSPDPQPTSPKAGGVFPACVVLHQWHWHERCEYWPTQCGCFSTPACLLMSVRA